ncbi:acylphosphatase [Frankia sp. Cppng1_Ct_nod]|uniref:acylphosphatase n=1 Tax=Frankia sp. Cppng1_Ct_nod TaxID=2897162 RepID=UPI0010411A38|nr:acylphosphatase [Frankia sp. Cppng1_Ct_nod]
MRDVPARPAGQDDHNPSAGSGPHARLTAWVSGSVQGVGFRAYVRSRGRRLGLVGSATNLTDGRVVVVVEGPTAACRTLLEMLQVGHTPGRTAEVTFSWSPPRGDLTGFVRR